MEHIRKAKASTASPLQAWKCAFQRLPRNFAEFKRLFLWMVELRGDLDQHFRSYRSNIAHVTSVRNYRFMVKHPLRHMLQEGSRMDFDHLLILDSKIILATLAYMGALHEKAFPM